mmetsp:Transcript_9750/g.24293  ORF Transcript_9750/g.24293 Transcript_9750/m.24293 type:complete len:308 (-) Transcript_9750:226-1149(-)
MSNNQEMISGTKRRPLQEEEQDELHSSYGEPLAKTRRTEHGFVFDTNDQSWTEEQHRDFVSSIFEIGLKHASPAIILENMNQKVETITSERVKSKLQKYRSSKNKEKSKTEFMGQYNEFLQKIQSIQATTANTMGDARADPVLLRFLEESAVRSSSDPCSLFLSGGDVAGYLTHCILKENKKHCNANPSSKSLDESSTTSSVLSTNVLRKGAREYVDNYAGCPIQFPILTETEKKSSLGIAMTFIAGLFLTMSQHLTRERARAETIGLGLHSPTSANNSPTTNSPTPSRNISNDTIDYDGSKGRANV